jgi:vacuolar protein sorting-associated protein 52
VSRRGLRSIWLSRLDSSCAVFDSQTPTHGFSCGPSNLALVGFLLYAFFFLCVCFHQFACRMDLKQSDLDDLATIDVDNDFLQANIDTHLDERSSQAALQDVCTAFVRSFLIEKGEWISSLHVSLKECVTVLEGMETVLEKFIEQIERIQQDIGDVRETLAKTSIELNNAKVAERVLWTAISHLVVPPEMVQIVTQTNDGELGMLFQLTLKELLKYLNYRKGVWQQPNLAVGAREAAGRSSTTQHPGSSWSTSRQRHIRELRLPLTEFHIYSELLTVLDSLTVFACVKVRDFLTRKLQVLAIPNTNVCIQQENNLKQLSFFVHFLRSAPPLLRHAHARGVRGGQQPTLVPYRITRAVYNEFKQHYCLIMSTLYLRKFQDYALTLNAMEYSTTASASFGSVGSTLLGGFTRVQPAAPNTVYTLPPVTETQSKSVGPGNVFDLGRRGEIFSRVFDPPLIPTLEKAAGRRHSYEETLRSLLHLLIDTVTHEYLFTFEFFSGDMSVYVDVFQPTLQFIVDYLSEVVLTQSTGTVQQLLNQHPCASVNAKAKDDMYGLLILIRLCHEYRFYMKTVRKLSCLDTFFDSLLVLLWPAFRRTFDAQLVALRCAQVSTLAAVTAHLRSMAQRIATVHPLVRNYSAMSCALLSVALGAALAEERMVANEVEAKPHRDASASPQSVGESSPSFTTSARSSSSTSSSSLDSAPSFDFPSRAAGIRATVLGSSEAAAGEPSVLDGSHRSTVNLLDRSASFQRDDALHAYTEVRRRAIEMMAMEDEADAAESHDRFVALVGNVDFVRVQVIHYAEEVVKYVLHQQTGSGVRPSAGSALMGMAGVMRDAYVLNQLHYMWTAAQESVFPGEERRGVTLTERFDFAQLRDMYDTYRARLQEEVLDVYFADFINVARSEEAVPPQVLVKVADHFLLTWKSALDALRSQVSLLLYESQLANELIAQMCMECLVCNTRFLKIVSAAVEAHPSVFAQRPIRTLIVSNQNILQHMRNYSMHLDTSGL